MTTSFALHRTTASGELHPSAFTRTFVVLGKSLGASSAPRASMRGQELRLGIWLEADDDASAGFLLDFPGQGARTLGEARGPSLELLAWAFHTLATAIGCELRRDDVTLTPDPEPHREAAMAYLAYYEEDVRESRKRKGEADDLDRFLAWLAREEHVALAEGAAPFAEPVASADATALYERLLDSDAIADLFISERELATLLGRFRARASR